MLLCIISISLDKYSFISRFRDGTAVYIHQRLGYVAQQIYNYPKLLFLQKTQQYSLEQENSKLKQQIEQYAMLLKQQKNLDHDKDNVADLTDFSTTYSQFQTIIARAIIDINYLVNNKLLIDRGTNSAINLGSAVVNQNGVIGQIFLTNSNNSQIMLITNPDFKIYVQSKETNSKMLAQGIGNNALMVKYINKNVNLKIGDILVTTGLDDIYPANLPVAKISKIFSENNGFNSAICQPVVDYNNLQFVAVLKNANK